MRRASTAEGTVGIFIRTRAWIYGTTNSWSLSPRGHEPSAECEVLLEIRGDEKQGYHLTMNPTGFFTADSWHATQQEALRTATELFGVAPEKWRNDP